MKRCLFSRQFLATHDVHGKEGTSNTSMEDAFGSVVTGWSLNAEMKSLVLGVETRSAPDQCL